MSAANSGTERNGTEISYKRLHYVLSDLLGYVPQYRNLSHASVGLDKPGSTAMNRFQHPLASLPLHGYSSKPHACRTAEAGGSAPYQAPAFVDTTLPYVAKLPCTQLRQGPCRPHPYRNTLNPLASDNIHHYWHLLLHIMASVNIHQDEGFQVPLQVEPIQSRSSDYKQTCRQKQHQHGHYRSRDSSLHGHYSHHAPTWRTARGNPSGVTGNQLALSRLVG